MCCAWLRHRATGQWGVQLVRLVFPFATQQVEDVGIYMPHTAAGSVLVDGVVATQLTTTAPQVGGAGCQRAAQQACPSCLPI